MYTETILYIVGGICAFLAVFFVVYLVVSRKRGKAYRDILRQETEFFDALTATSPQTKRTGPASTRKKSEASLPTTVKITETTSEGVDKTELLEEDSEAETIDFDASALEDRYIIRKEIHGGGMSRVFLAESVKLGNQWIVKFISAQNGKLANEENILKLLNHISLPKIVDIFQDNKGVYLVESFIEGVTLDKVLESGQKINQFIVMEWAEQLAQVLNYLHRLEPNPIHHYDLKPSNIIVTHDNRLVLIDFGISKRFGEDGTEAAGVTYRYAAPEQLTHHIPEKYMPLIESRFGGLPAQRQQWTLDARTDIYGLGVILFELAVGQIPTMQNMNALKDAVSRELLEIIGKCLAVNPDGRYQSAGEFLAALQKVKGSKIKMARTLFMRRLASVSCAVSILASGGSVTGGYIYYTQESAALIDVRPEIVTVSLQQSTELAVEKKMPNGSVSVLDNERITWSYSDDNVARIDGSRISGLNLGETDLSGRYRNKTISLNVRVVEPMDGMVDISQRYRPGRAVQIYAGSMERDPVDGALAEAEFTSPEGVAVAADGTIYISDAGVLRRISGGRVESIYIEPSHMTPDIVRCLGDEVYITTHEWEEDDGYYYAIGKLKGGSLEVLRTADAQFTAIEDFEVFSDGMIYYIERNAGADEVYLQRQSIADAQDIYTLCKLPEGTCSMAMDSGGAVYLANAETGAIQVWRDGALEYFAGVENEKAFIDGNAPLFYMPQKVKYADGYLFVWDFNVLRRISVTGGTAGECITIAGEASPTFEPELTQAAQAAEDVILPNSKLTDFVVRGESVLLTDPKRGVIWQVE